ncbi:polysaccharide deacetylase family protein [Streptomyces hydrogenans]|uniref:polysaccharide deacetylase family protein n=1 Tax=Streptomyces hydrogenans TaxID=1873719 RepID=UPI00167E1441|nr:polysaccharide deacetylase [Streptomyces hydrogenans]GHG43239.1 polysaccharide deacetylase [Streptomyces hydrogenans]
MPLPRPAPTAAASLAEPDLAWPDGAEAAVSFTFDVDAEAGWLGEGEAYSRRLTTLSEGRYGVVRGMPRILRLLAEYETRGTFFVPGHTAELYPGMVEDVLAAGHEIAHHGHMHLRSDKVSAAEQRAEIEKGLAALSAAGAPVPTGYRSTSWELTPETFGLLVEHGFGYDSSCMGDDRPYYETHAGGSLLELPVHWSLDDWPRYGWNIDTGGNQAAPGELYTSWLTEYEWAKAERRHVCYTMHPEVIGRPQRFAELARLVAAVAEDGHAWTVPLADVAAHVRPLIPAPHAAVPR